MEHSQSARMGVASFSSSAVIPHSGSCWPPLPPRSIPTNVPHSRGTLSVLLKPSSHPPHISPLFPLRYPLKLGAAIPRCLPTNVCSASNSSSMSSTTIQRHRSAAAQLVGHHLPPDLVDQMVSEALVWCSLHGLLVADRKVEKSGTIPGVGLVHAPFALLPVPFPESHWRQACELAPIFNEVVDRVSLDAEFLQEALSRTKKVDPFTSKLLDIHSKMVEMGKKETIRLGLHRSDYMLDSATKLLYQIELNTIASSFSGLGCLVTELHRNLLNFHGNKLGMDSRQVAGNAAASQFAETLAKAWHEYNDPSAVVIVIAQPEEHNMYDQYWLQTLLKENHDITTIRKTLAEVDSEGKVLPDGTLHIDGHNVAVVYYRAGYSPIDYPTEKEWKARFLMEKSLAIKCPSISYHLVGTKKIQQELAKPNVLERFIENKKDIEKLRKCFAGLWSLDDQDIIEECKQNPELFVLKPQREGGGNNIYGAAARDTIIRLQNNGGEDLSAYILMQRIFPSISPSFLVRDGMYRHGEVVSELGIFGAYLRNNEKVVVNDQCGYLVRTKASSSNEGGVAAGFAVLDSIYLI